MRTVEFIWPRRLGDVSPAQVGPITFGSFRFPVGGTAAPAGHTFGHHGIELRGNAITSTTNGRN